VLERNWLRSKQNVAYGIFRWQSQRIPWTVWPSQNKKRESSSLTTSAPVQHMAWHTVPHHVLSFAMACCSLDRLIVMISFSLRSSDSSSQSTAIQFTLWPNELILLAGNRSPGAWLSTLSYRTKHRGSPIQVMLVPNNQGREAERCAWIFCCDIRLVFSFYPSCYQWLNKINWCMLYSYSLIPTNHDIVQGRQWPSANDAKAVRW
jgi:hypothetical protein